MPPPRNSWSSYLPIRAGRSITLTLSCTLILACRRCDAPETIQKVLVKDSRSAAQIHEEFRFGELPVLIAATLSVHHDVISALAGDLRVHEETEHGPQAGFIESGL